MLNGRLEDAAVGIGSVARERRKGFVASWQQAYWLQPLEGGALMRCFPDDWRLYRQDPDGYRQLEVLPERPDPDTCTGFTEPVALATAFESLGDQTTPARAAKATTPATASMSERDRSLLSTIEGEPGIEP